jgi:glycosyltransferase involved in cell wall biosynthesis
VDERLFTARENYRLRRKILIAGAAPFKSGDLKKKGIEIVKSKIPNLKLITGRSHEQALKEMAKCDIFTHGIYYAYGYTLIEAAMMGIPCFGSISDRDKKHVLLDGEYPVYEIGQQGEKISEMLEFFSSKENRIIYGKKMRRWAMKYHSQKACYKTYKKLLEELI